MTHSTFCSLSNQKYIKILFPASTLGLTLLLSLALLCPLSFSNTHATDCLSSQSSCVSSAETRVSIQAAPAVSVSLGKSVNVDITPTSIGAFGYNSTELRVFTNNEEGYKIYLATTDETGALKNSNTDKTGEGYQINGLSGEVTGGANFPVNTWGYALSNLVVDANSTYSPVPTNLATAALNVSSASPTGEDVYNLGFGTKIGTNLAAGEYSNSVVVSVVANSRTVSTFSELTYMQDMKPEFCNNATVDTTKQLIDTRDGKRYWVAKLADGNCWMTQNLALDLDPAKPLTPSDSDVTANWTPTVKTETEIMQLDKTDAAVQNTQARSWNLGQIVLTNPTGSSLCTAALPDALKGLGYSTDNLNSAYFGQTLTEVCKWYQDVSNMVGGYEATTTNSINSNNLSYDEHYLIGNYYQWGAITAGTGVATNNTNVANGNSGLTDANKLVDATASICPKGWRLPTDGVYENGLSGQNSISWPYNRDDSFYALLSAYNYPETGSSVNDTSQSTTNWITNGGNPYTSITGNSKTRLDYTPMYFVRSGCLSPATGSMRLVGNDGYYWSSTPYPGSNVNTYVLDFNPSIVYPTHRVARSNAFSARCVAR